MESKRSSGTDIFAIIEIILGGLGSFLFFYALLAYIGQGGGIMIAIAKHFIRVLWPYTLLLISGIGVFKFKLWAIYINISILPMLFFCYYGLMVFYGNNGITPLKYWDYVSYYNIILFLFLAIQAVFFIRPSIRKQFARREKLSQTKID